MLATDVTAVTCPACGIEFALTKNFMAILRGTGKTFWCPNGHKLECVPAKDPPAQVAKERDLWESKAEELLDEVNELKVRLGERLPEPKEPPLFIPPTKPLGGLLPPKFKNPWSKPK